VYYTNASMSVCVSMRRCLLLSIILSYGWHDHLINIHILYKHCHMKLAMPYDYICVCNGINLWSNGHLIVHVHVNCSTKTNQKYIDKAK